VRREVWARDGHRCQFPLDRGGVCGSDHRLELDHVVPVALGGASTAENLRVACRAHNQAAARARLGEARAAERRRRALAGPRSDGGDTG
jgi:5-methylcytosine-specific restriction endonuclease McrA